MNIGIDARCFARGKTTGVEGYTKNFLTAVFSGDATHTYHIFFNAWKAQHVDLSWMEAFPHVRVHRFRIPNKLLNSALWFFRRPRLNRLVGGVDVFLRRIPISLHFLHMFHSSSQHTTSPLSTFRTHFATHAPVALHHQSTNTYTPCTHILAVSASTKDDVCATYRIPSRRVRGTERSNAGCRHN